MDILKLVVYALARFAIGISCSPVRYLLCIRRLQFLRCVAWIARCLFYSLTRWTGTAYLVRNKYGEIDSLVCASSLYCRRPFPWYSRVVQFLDLYDLGFIFHAWRNISGILTPHFRHILSASNSGDEFLEIGCSLLTYLTNRTSCSEAIEISMFRLRWQVIEHGVEP